ncbi:hypothetical protein [Streptomyces chryseus]|uniref:hypothetical protein n=1 Tax=Streptomyces chryseus TaxID=68186 RepID=UPI00110FC022|nr:hypothetical protein [Streptomyces chryseus]GGX36611.1 hypothetical protein GCM10010353_59660 [Streptomyces chryseus]
MACDVAGFFGAAGIVACTAAEWGAKEAGDSAFDAIVKSASDSAGWIIRELTTGWLRIDTPKLNQETGTVEFLRSSTMWLTNWMAVLALLIASGRMIWEQRSEPAKQALAGVLRLVVVSSGAIAAVNLLGRGGDQFSVWIINRSTGCSQAAEATGKCVDAFGERVLAMTAFGAVSSSMGGILILVMALLIIFASLIQMALMLARNAMLIILAGTLPLSAAASSTEGGRAWFHKSLGWLIAFLAYKPVAAIVYAAAFSSMGQSRTHEIPTQISGVVLLFLAVFTLPALMKFVTPMVAATAAAGGGAGAAVAGAGQAVASGAIAIKTAGASKAGTAAAGAARGAGTPGAGQVGKPPNTPPSGPPGGGPPSGGPTGGDSAGQGVPTGKNEPGSNGGRGQADGSNRAPAGVPPQGGGGQTQGAATTPAGANRGGGVQAPSIERRKSNDREGGPSGSN